MKLWAGVTDNNWYSFLAERGLDEVNFWRPSPGPYFTGLPAGTHFLETAVRQKLVTNAAKDSVEKEKGVAIA